MSKETKYLKDISKPIKKSPDEFLAMSGDIELGNKITAALRIGYYYQSQYRQEDIKHDYIDLVKDMVIDSTCYGFYNNDESRNDRFTSFTQAAEKYNQIILEKSQNNENLIYNIPKQSIEIEQTYVRGMGYRESAQQCEILAVQKSIQDIEKSVVLLHKEGKFAVVENVEKDKYGRLNLLSINNIKFEIESIQEILDKFTIITKCQVINGKEENNITSELEKKEAELSQLEAEAVKIGEIEKEIDQKENGR